MASLRKGLGKRLQQLRKAVGLTQEELARRAKIDWKYLGSIERGEKSVSLEVLERLMKALGVQPYEPFLFGWQESRRGKAVDEDVLVNMVKHTDPSVRPFIVELVQTALGWAQKRKR